ncbi:ankyrin repeat-containing domain protein, partial [Triangularia verruculosa]
RIEVVSLLLEHEHSQETFQESLEAALEENNWEGIKMLLRRSDSRLDCTEVFTEASTGGESLDDVLDEIWKHTQGCIDQKLLNACLYTATDNEKESTVRVLLRVGADPNAAGELYGNALTAAANDGVTADDGTVPIVQALLDAGATVTSDTGWALQIAAEQRHLAVVKLLLKWGADINHLSETHPSGTALQAACDCGHEDIVEFLVSEGADPNVGGGINEYPIIAASMNSDVLPHLLTAPGIELDVIGGPDRANPLIYAARSLPVESMEQLIHAGADVDMADEVGDTPLIAAADSGDSECVKLLLKHGADIMVVNHDRGTALEVALEEGDEECSELLATRAADILKRLQTSAQSGSKLARRIITQERESRDYEQDEQDMKASTGSQEPDGDQGSELGDHLARLNLDDDNGDGNDDDRNGDDDTGTTDNDDGKGHDDEGGDDESDDDEGEYSD